MIDPLNTCNICDLEIKTPNAAGYCDEHLKEIETRPKKKKKKTHIQDLFDAINGGDDVDAASEAQEIMGNLLATLKAEHARHCTSRALYCSTCDLIATAENRR